jgi:hypothetical protein
MLIYLLSKRSPQHSYQLLEWFTNLLIVQSGGRVSCIALDAESGAVAVADDGCRLLLYTQKGGSDAGADEHMFHDEVKGARN